MSKINQHTGNGYGQISVFTRCWLWIKRIRHLRGFGIQSPSDFYLATSVIYERLPYAAYTEAEKRASAFIPATGSTQRTDRLLLRLVNYFQPISLLEIAPYPTRAFLYMQVGKPSASAQSITAEKLSELQPEGWHFMHIDHITAIPHNTIETLLSHANPHSCMVISGIHTTPANKERWQWILEHRATRISFDLYHLGIVLFNPKRHPEHYQINFF